MNYRMQDDGLWFLSQVLIGGGGTINGMYLEYTGSGDITVGPRDTEYYRTLDSLSQSGYLRIRGVRGYVDKDCRMHFDALLTGEEIPEMADGMTASCVTLVSMQDDCREHDRIICTMKLSSPVVLRKDAMTTIHTSMKLGA